MLEGIDFAAGGDAVIRVESLWKEYRLGTISHGTLKADLASWWASIRGKDDPNRRLGPPVRPSTPQVCDDSPSTPDRFWALRDVAFDVKQGEVLGIVGRNGAGKSTLLKILSRVTTPTRGEIKVRGRVASLLEVGTGFHPELTGRDNIFLNGAILGMSKIEIRRKFDEIVAFAEVEKFIDTPVKRYSSGMYVRLAFAVAAHLEPEILVVDEVLAVGDAAFQKKCLGKIGEVAKGGRTVLFVSHNMIAVERLCSQALLLCNGQLTHMGRAKDVVTAYLSMVEKDGEPAVSQRDGFLFSRIGLSTSEDFAITGIQLIDRDGSVLGSFGTWDEVGIRIHYAARVPLARGSVVLIIGTPEGATMILTSTSPDRTQSMRIEEGEGYADCIFHRWPLAAGVYVVGAGLAIPGVEFVCRDDSLCRVSVAKKDIYGSGLAPSADRYYVASEHFWRVPDGGRDRAAIGKDPV